LTVAIVDGVQLAAAAVVVEPEPAAGVEPLDVDEEDEEELLPQAASANALRRASTAIGSARLMSRQA
jgi:hypothetical protein